MSLTTGARIDRLARSRQHRPILRILEKPLRILDARRLPPGDQEQQRDADPRHRHLRRDRCDRHPKRQRQRRCQRDEPVAVVAARRRREEHVAITMAPAVTATSNQVPAIADATISARPQHGDRKVERIRCGQHQIAGDAGHGVEGRPGPEYLGVRQPRDRRRRPCGARAR